MGPCCLVFGVSGVGKTSACSAFTQRHPNWLFVSASTLLKAAKGATGERLRTADSQSIVDNQLVLADAVRQFRSGRVERPMLLDAHAVIDNDRELVRVPVEVIRALQPSLFVLLEAPAQVVLERRLADTRQRPVRDVASIERELAAERSAVADYSVDVGVELLKANVTSDFVLESVFKEIILD